MTTKIIADRSILLHHPAAPLPVVGMPATVRLWTDSYAAVVTRVTRKTITVARVETGPVRPDEASDVGAYGLRPTLADGILDKIIPGTEQRYTRGTNGQYRNAGQLVTLGHSVTRVDWRA
jgi:hypothetical protein